jgi:hypothetical protein
MRPPDRTTRVTEQQTAIIKIDGTTSTGQALVMTKDKLFVPGPGRIFVFGSNRAGIHGAGAALTAKKKYGARQHVGEGLQGNSYAIPTKDERIETLPLVEIRKGVDRFLAFARSRHDLSFFVTRIGCGLAGYSDTDIGPMFAGAPRKLRAARRLGRVAIEWDRDGGS